VGPFDGSAKDQELLSQGEILGGQGQRAKQETAEKEEGDS
jgi:hypothetical protein